MSDVVHAEKRLQGLPLSKGLVVARVCMLNEHRHSSMPVYRIAEADRGREVERLREAVGMAIARIEVVREDVQKRIGSAEAEIFSAQIMILQDEQMLGEICGVIESDQRNAEAAVAQVLDRYEARLLEMDDEYIKERASDIGEIRRRLVDLLGNIQASFLCENTGECTRGRGRIVVASELTPSLTVELHANETLGFVTERGGANSHAAILARAMGVPAVSGIENVQRMISCGTEVLVCGESGQVILWPTEATVTSFRQGQAAGAAPAQVEGPVPGFEVHANISVAGDMADVLAVQAEGIGLYRTEFEFMGVGRELSEDEQFERYASVVKAMNGKPVTFRALDMGGDKPFEFLGLPEEVNPALGCRGARLLLRFPRLLHIQARALARASRVGPVRVMYPMVVDLDQFRALKALFREATASMDGGPIQHGVMFEVPAACLDADRLLAEADFASVGTNDLTQYLFAVDRDNDLVAHDYDPDRPVFWAMLQRLVDAARAAGKPLSVCGEMAGDARLLSRLLDIGLAAVSVSPRLIPDVRRAARAVRV